MIDLHCHILPQVDDGATSWNQTTEMCRIAAQDGIRHIVATPHANHEYDYDRKRFESMLETLRASCGDLLHFTLGCDFQFSYENIEDVLIRPGWYTIANSKYLLIELSDFSLMSIVRRGIFRLVGNGFIPIVTHPERNLVLLQNPEKVLELIECGCLIQVTAGSFTGHWGQRSQRMAEWLLRRDAIHAVASDAHDTRFRPPILSAAYERVCSLTKNAVAQALFIDNPSAIISTERASRKEVLPKFPTIDGP